MYKKILFTILLIISTVSHVYADSCDYEDIKRLKEIAKGIEIMYTLQEEVQQEYGTLKDLYTLSISGSTEELLIYNKTDNESYQYESAQDGIITIKNLSSGIKKIEIYPTNCANVVRRETIKLPIYNYYSESDSCKNLKSKNLKVCEKWTENKITETEFYKEIEKYQEEKETSLLDKIKQYKYYILAISLLIIVLIIINLLQKKKRGRLE